LMIENPDLYLDAFAKAGSDTLIVHWEGNANLHRTVQHIKSLGKKAGVAINPATPSDVLSAILPDLDLILVMTVNPGFGGQTFIHSTLAKIEQVRGMIEHVNPSIELEIDGGVDSATAPLGVRAGANVLVAGSSVFGTADGVGASMERLRLCAK
jgi:ribulose-phosphate 3-epimerase